MTKVFLNVLPIIAQIRHLSSKIPKLGTFGPKFRHFHYFTIFCNSTNSRLLISNLTIVFWKFLPWKYPIKAFLVKNTQIKYFWCQISAFLFLHQILQLDKFKGADFKYDKNFFKSLAKIYPNKAFLVKNVQIRHFWSQILTFLFLHKILQLDKLKGADLKYDKSFFLNSSPKIPK